MSDNGNTKKVASRRPPTALFIWLGIFLVFGLFFLLSDDSAEKTDILTPHEFVTALDNGEIISADVVSGPERFFLIRGKWKKKAASGSAQEDKDLSAGTERNYEINLPATDELITKLQNGKVAKLKYEEDKSFSM